MRKMIRLWFALACLLMTGSALAVQVSRIGVLSFQSKPETLAQWMPTAQALSQQLPQYRFEIVPLNYEELDAAVQAASIDFVFTNPEHYAVLRGQYGLRPMATLNLLIDGQVIDQFGSVIFTRSDSGIAKLEDVHAKRVAAVGANSLGGYLMAADLFRQHDIALLSGNQVSLVFTGVPHSLVVQRVLSGQSQVGIVRTGVLERLQAQGQLDMRTLQVLNARSVKGFPLLLSTDLYPEWPWAAIQHPPGELVKAVTLALLQIRSGTKAALAGGYHGFSTPADYTPVEELMRRLKVYPGLQERAILTVLWDDHQGTIALVALLCLAAGLGLSGYLWRSNQRLRELTQLNREAQVGLEVTAAAFNSEVGLFITDELTHIKRANAAVTAMLGYTQADLAGHSTHLLRGATLAKGTLRELWSTVKATGRWQGELSCRHHDGHDVPCLVTIATIHNHDAGRGGYVGSVVDISQQKKAQADIQQLAFYDPLTQLSNRRMFLGNLQLALRAATLEGTLASVMFIDLDHFKNLNDSHGHTVGDQLLQLIAQRLHVLILAPNLCARLGGDEFVVMLIGLDANETAAMEMTLHVAQSIHQTLRTPFELDAASDFGKHAQTLRYTCSASIGLALFGLVDEPLTEVLKRADVAMYKAKKDGRNLIRQYDPSAQRALDERMALSNDLNLALRDHQLKLLYQLQVDIRDEAVGAECLMRWHHPTRGLVSPVEFIPLAEDSGAIIAMGDWVVHSACETLARWAAVPALQHLMLSVNVSPRQFSEADFVERVSSILAQTGARPERLRLEVTEGIVMQDTQLVIDRMQELCAMGLSFSIDDFGTGYSSMSYIQMLPLAELKIDKAFVSDLITNHRSEAIVKAIIALGHSMNITIVSEGVETQAQKDRLLSLGCTLLQGYLISRPIECAELELMVAHQHAPSLPTTAPAESHQPTHRP